VAEPPILCWPDNLHAVRVFMAAATQWRIGMAGPTGLDYAALPELWRRLTVPRKARDAAFADLQVLEAAALDAIHTKD